MKISKIPAILTLAFVLTLAPWTVLFAQLLSEHDNPTLTRTIPPSPTAASLSKYGEFPVSYYTGLPNISIPIYEVKSGDLSLPISLSYHAGGIKVEEIASWVGLGWSLNAGGVISRTIRGIADEIDDRSGFGNYREAFNTVVDPSTSTSIKNDILNFVQHGQQDLESDIYHFNFAGYSGKFYMDADPSDPSILIPHLQPQQGLKITYDRNGPHVIRWTVTTENGVKYVFGRSLDGTRDEREKNQPYSVCRTEVAGDYGDLEAGDIDIEIANSWYLAEVISPTGHRIDIFYDDYDLRYRTFGSETAYYLVPGTDHYANAGEEPKCGDRFNHCYVRNQMKSKRLRSIETANLTVEFLTQSGYRYDLCQDKALESIAVYNNFQTEPLLEYQFDYGYFKRPQDPAVPSPLPTTTCLESDQNNQYRLKLETLTEVSGTSKPPYVFTYEESQHLPPRLHYDGATLHPTAYAQDHWGYFNGELNNRRRVTGPSSLLPTFSVTLIDQNAQTIQYGMEGANRSSYGQFAKAYTLKTIQYPTGGTTTFDFEANKIANTQIPADYTLTQADRTVGPYNFDSDLAGETEDFPSFSIDSDYETNAGVQGAFVTFLPHERGACPTDPASWVVRYYVIDANTNAVAYANGIEATQFIPNGSYFIRLEREQGGPTCHSEFSLKLDWVETDGGVTAPQDVEVGGLRIRQMTSHDGADPANNLVTTFDYQQFLNENLSSGYMVNFPVYGWELFYTEWFRVVLETPGGSPQPVTFACPYIVRQSFSQYPLAMTNGGYVGYENVSVVKGAQQEAGKTEYTFTSPKVYPDEFTTMAPPTSYDWRRGLESLVTQKSKELTTYKTVAETSNQYQFDLKKESPGMKTTLVHNFGSQTTENNLPLGVNTYLEQVYNTVSERVYRSQTISKDHYSPDETTWNQRQEDYIYSPLHYQMTSSTAKNSDGTETIIKNTYALDIDQAAGIPTTPADDDGKALRALIDRHILSAVVEQQMIRKEGATQTLLGGKINTFKLNANNDLVPDTEYFLETATPLTDLAGIGYTAGVGLDFNSAYEEGAVFEKFDPLGNILQYTGRDGITTSFIWGYGGEYPVVQVVGATVAEVEVAIGSGFDAGNVSTNLTASQLSDLRAGLPDAFVTSYDYEPGRGLITQIGPDNQIVRYEYDDFGRLFRVRDHLDNVIQQYEYHYANQND